MTMPEKGERLSTAFAEGAQVAAAGGLKTANPIAADDTVAIAAWDRGWEAGKGVSAYAADTAAPEGLVATSGGNVYVVATAGTTGAASAPTTTAPAITDGTVVWRFMGVGTDFDLGCAGLNNPGNPPYVGTWGGAV